MTRQQPITYRGYSIEQENSGTFSLYRFGYVRGGFKTSEEAKSLVDFWHG